MNKGKNIVLIGFMGTGKTSIGRRLAAYLKREFIDTDHEIEKVTGLTIARIFKKHGIIRFRSEETLVIQKLADRSNLVVSTGGGAVLKQDNIDLLKKNGILIGLSAAPEIIYQRVKKNSNRPLLKRRNDLLNQIKTMLSQRQGAYSLAEFTVDTGLGQPDETMRNIISFLKERDYL